VPSVESLELRPTVTSAVGWVLSTTVNVAVPPASVVARPDVGFVTWNDRELGIAVTFDTAPILVTENINPGGRERAHAISLLYRCRLTSTLNPCRRYTQESPVPDQWLWHERCPTNLIPKQRAYAALIG